VWFDMSSACVCVRERERERGRRESERDIVRETHTQKRRRGTREMCESRESVYAE